MNHNKNRRPRGTAVRAGEPDTTVTNLTDPHADRYAWGAVFLVGGRVTSIAALRGWPGACTSHWRRYR